MARVGGCVSLGVIAEPEMRRRVPVFMGRRAVIRSVVLRDGCEAV